MNRLHRLVTERHSKELIYAGLLIGSLFSEYALIALFFVFGLLCIAEFNKLIDLKGIGSYIIFIVLYGTFTLWQTFFDTVEGFDEAIAKWKYCVFHWRRD